MAQKIPSSVASASSFPQISRTVLLQVFLPVTFDTFICILWWSHTSSSFSCSVFSSATDRWEYGCCVPTELGNCMMLASVAMQGVSCCLSWAVSLRSFLPLIEKAAGGSVWALRSNNTPVVCQQSSHPGSQLSCKRQGPKVTMKNALESPIWKIVVVLFCGFLGFFYRWQWISIFNGKLNDEQANLSASPCSALKGCTKLPAFVTSSLASQ